MGTAMEALALGASLAGSQPLENVRIMLEPAGPGHLAVKAYGRPVGGGRGAYVSFPVPDDPELAALVAAAADRAGELWAAHRGLR